MSRRVEVRVGDDRHFLTPEEIQENLNFQINEFKEYQKSRRWLKLARGLMNTANMPERIAVWKIAKNIRQRIVRWAGITTRLLHDRAHPARLLCVGDIGEFKEYQSPEAAFELQWAEWLTTLRERPRTGQVCIRFRKT